MTVIVTFSCVVSALAKAVTVVVKSPLVGETLTLLKSLLDQVTVIPLFGIS